VHSLSNDLSLTVLLRNVLESVVSLRQLDSVKPNFENFSGYLLPLLLYHAVLHVSSRRINFTIDL
jgi:hypothetical protein